MLYREMGQTGDRLSILGYGCMRFPKKDGHIDEERTETQIISAIERGVNYFDTAYFYDNGKSEITLGKVLAKGYRDKVKVATKLPLPLVHSRKDMENLISTQLKRLQTDHIDYYLMHMITTRGGWERLKGLGVIEFIESARESGKIGHVGFSYHGGKDDFREVVDDYPWEFCQIQLNYMDEHNQAGKEGLLHAASRGLGVVIMEPLRGGRLGAKMPAEAGAIFERADAKRTPAEWALRWLWNMPEVTVVLSGMNEESHIDENIRIASEALPQALSSEELQPVRDVRDYLKRVTKVGCTGCGYCMPCPAGVNIPYCFSSYNDRYIYGGRDIQGMYIGSTTGIDGGKPSYASLCKECGKCEEHCPQKLPIRKHLKEVAGEMEPIYFKPAAGLIRGYYGIRKILRRG